MRPESEEELGEAVESRLELRMLDAKVVLRGLLAGSSVGTPTMVLDELPVLLDVGVLLRAHEQHVLEEVREALAVLRVGELAHVYQDRGGRHVGVAIGYHKRLHPIIQGERLVLAVV
jgi:hypothetical protein